jgi:hypothetical protein
LVFFFFFFLQDWALNSGHHACKAGAPLLDHAFGLLILEMGFHELFAQAGL